MKLNCFYGPASPPLSSGAKMKVLKNPEDDTTVGMVIGIVVIITTWAFIASRVIGRLVYN